MKKKYALFIGRWQTWHKGHEWLISQQLDKGKNVWIAVRDVEVDEKNPKSAHEVTTDLFNVPFIIENWDRILITTIPDIDSVNYGRDVGYEVVYHEPPSDISKISGTKIRNKEIDADGKSYETYS
jgi:phosphopantetheine adenylyltransferase